MIEFQPVAVPGFGSGASQAGIGGQVTLDEPPPPSLPLLLLLLPLLLPPLPPAPPLAPDPVVDAVFDVSEPHPEMVKSAASEPRKKAYRFITRP